MEWYWWIVGAVLVLGALFVWYSGKVRECARDDLPGDVFNAPEAIRQVAEGTLDGLPNDGRYYAIHFLQQCNRARWIAGGAMTGDQIREYVDALAHDYGRQPTNTKPDPMDPAGGMYSVKGPHGHTEHLMVFPPNNVGGTRRARELVERLGLPPDSMDKIARGR